MRDEASRFSKWAGWSGLIGSFAFLATVVVANVWNNAVEGVSDPSDVTRFMGEVSDSSASFIAYGVAGIVLSVFYIPMSFGVHRRLNRSTRSWFGTAMVVIGLGILVPAYVIALLVPTGLAPLAEELGSVGAEAIYVLNEVAGVGALLFFTAGSVLTLAFGPYLWAREALSSGAFSRWLGWLGVVTGITGLIWFVWFMDSPIILPVLVTNFVASLVFYTGLSVALLKGRSPGTAEPILEEVLTSA